MQSSPILIIGATGKTGRRVADLLEAGGHTVRRASRNAQTRFDWDDPATWTQVLSGVSAAYITYAPDLAFPGAPEKFLMLTEMARNAGVRRLVMLAGRGEPRAEICEEIIRKSGMEYTLVRAAWFAQNFSEGFLQEAVMDGTLALPAGDVAEPFVDIDDLAEVVVAALTEPHHVGQEYEVTGPQLLTFEEATAELSLWTGQSLSYQAITSEQFREALTELGGPLLADVFTEVCRQIFDGRNAKLGNGVERALGRPPRAFSDFCARAAARGAWAKAA